MYRLLHSIAMVAVLAHMVFGCCLHHAHGSCGTSFGDASFAAQSAGPHGLRSPAVVEHTGCHCHAADCLSHENAPEHKGCDERDCVFIKPDDSSSGDLFAPSIDGLFPAPLAAHAGQSLRVPCQPVAIPSPLRLHLMNQVLLV
ncbi:MAG: hypothetical protein HUU20_05525 [Pirellulales bacterium]|nr:hypothetical protein [Pirellulales bacterium]